MSASGGNDSTILAAVIHISVIEILKFGAEWCEPCTRQETVLRNLGDDHPEVTIRDIDVEEPGNRELKRRFEPRALPTTVILVDEQPHTQFTGFVNRDRIEETLAEINPEQSPA